MLAPVGFCSIGIANPHEVEQVAIRVQ